MMPAMQALIFEVRLEPDAEGIRAFYPPWEHFGASTWGETEQEAHRHIHEVLAMRHEAFGEVGEPLPGEQASIATECPALAVTR